MIYTLLDSFLGSTTRQSHDTEFEIEPSEARGDPAGPF